jgi:hypothetical protein
VDVLGLEVAHPRHALCENRAVPSAFAVLLGVLLMSAGGWAAIHPNGGYRAVGGVGSGFAPSTRRFWGVIFGVLGLLIVLVTLT